MISNEIIKFASNTSNVGLTNKYTFKSNSQFYSKYNDFIYEINTNNFGFRDREINSIKPDIKKKVYFFAGDSFLESVGLNYRDTLIGQLAERTNNEYLLLNSGVASYSPYLYKRKIISFIGKSKLFVPHFHIPLQSGSNQILRNMKRRYNKDLYRDRINLINNTIPNVCIGVDVIVGFPGETEEYFNETLNFLKELNISYLHVFTYSERDNTIATELSNPVPMEVRSKRSMILRSLSDKKRRSFYQSQIGSYKTVLYETENKKGYIYGYTENYLRVRSPWNPELANKLKSVRINRIDSEGYIRIEEKVKEECLSI